MATIDSEQERRRLAEFYAGQLDGELKNVAQEAYELSGLAREALRNELAKRGLPTRLVEQRPAPPPLKPLPGDPPPAAPLEELPQGELDMQEMVTVRRFRDLPEALLAKGSLDSAGIECVLVNENLVRLDWFWSNLMGGVMLQVDPDDVEAANAILSQPIPEEFEAEGTGEYRQPRCPSCGSLDVSFQELNKPVAFVSAYVGIPIPLQRAAWRCDACKFEWEEDAEPGATTSGN